MLNEYSLVQWCAFFFIYCFGGWCVESTYVSVKSKRFVNRGFLMVPMLPIYGFGAVVMLIATLPYRDSIILVYLSGLFGATLLEYVTGAIMESLFKIKYWDYSNERIQYRGRICLTSSLFWGVLSVVLTHILHPPVERAILNMNQSWLTISVCIVAVIMAIDTVISAKAAIDLSKILTKVENAKLELERLQRQLDDIMESTTERVTAIRDKSSQEAGELVLAAREKTESIRVKINEVIEDRRISLSKMSFFNEQLLKRHPSATSQRAGDSLRELKSKLFDKEKFVKSYEEKKAEYEAKCNAFIDKLEEYSGKFKK